ncbi:hypothetical protein BST81_07245 [Leptolyngbya sp. 'hensonii']|nr:hypothetical protein BST81_07245 [Leptolyngbya sp. 'hensonii']
MQKPCESWVEQSETQPAKKVLSVNQLTLSSALTSKLGFDLLSLATQTQWGGPTGYKEGQKESQLIYGSGERV